MCSLIWGQACFNGCVDRGELVAGPEVFTLVELGRITLAARGDHRTVVTDDSAGMFDAVRGDPCRQGRRRHRQDQLTGMARPLSRARQDCSNTV